MIKAVYTSTKGWYNYYIDALLHQLRHRLGKKPPTRRVDAAAVAKVATHGSGAVSNVPGAGAP